jgi:hypothetical protein
MRGFRRAQLRGSDELFLRTGEQEEQEQPASAVTDERPAVTPVPAAPSPDLRSVRLTEPEIQTLADAVQHLKFPQKGSTRPSVDDFERLETLRQKLLDALD